MPKRGGSKNLFENETLKSKESLKMKRKRVEIYLKIEMWKVIYKIGLKIIIK